MALAGFTDDLDEFIYGGVPILPEQDSYTLTMPTGVVRSDIAGGMPKAALQFFNAPYGVSATYVSLDASKLMFIEAFINRHRGQKFIAYLLISSGEIEPFVCQFVGEPKLPKTGFNGSVSLTLEVEPGIDRCLEDFVLEFAPCVGDLAKAACNVNKAVTVWP